MNVNLLRISLARPCDAINLQAYFRRLSRPSRYNRFLGGVGDVSLDTVTRMIGAAGSNLFSIMAVSGPADGSRIVGEAVCEIAREAEVALSVEDASQGNGVGRALLKSIEVMAAKRGAAKLYGYGWINNEPIRALAANLGCTVDRASGERHLCILRKSLAMAPSVNFRRTAAASAGS